MRQETRPLRGRGAKLDPDHFVVEDEHALATEGEDVDGHLDVLQIGVAMMTRASSTISLTGTPPPRVCSSWP